MEETPSDTPADTRAAVIEELYGRPASSARNLACLGSSEAGAKRATMMTCVTCWSPGMTASI